MKTPERIYAKHLLYDAVQLKIYKSILIFETEEKDERCDITNFIQEEVKLSHIKNGECIIRCPHTTCSIFINEAEHALLEDLEHNFSQLVLIKKLNEMCPHGKYFQHGCEKCDSICNRNNAAAHIKTILENGTAMLQVEICGGKLNLGTWQNIILWEHDGPREKRELKIKIISDY